MDPDVTYLQLTTITALLVIIAVLLAKLVRVMEEPREMVGIIHRAETLERPESPNLPRDSKE